MMFLKQYCPTFRRISLWLWNSPTFTTWGNYAVQSLRLILVTPLILTRFNETEIAAWYLFGSLNFFGLILSQRLGLTFSRMFAFAMGGASNLAPIEGKRDIENNGQPNWHSFERAYGTIVSTNRLLGWLNVMVAFGMGWFALNNLLSGYSENTTIWIAFALMQSTSLIRFMFQHYEFALRGMNYVALTNRWGMIFALLSCLVGSITLYLGGGLIALVLAMQVMMLAGIFRNYFLVRSVEGGRVAAFKGFGFNREVFGWAWSPTWKGFVGQIGQQGSLQLVAIVYTAFGSKPEVASFLFALRMMQTVTQIAQAPFGAVQPLMSRLRAEGNIARLRELVRKRAAISLVLVLAGVMAGAVVFPFALTLIGSNLDFIPVPAWLLLGFLTLLAKFNTFCCAVCAIGNQMVYYWQAAIAAGVAAFGLLIVQNDFGVYGPVVFTLAPLILILNFGPFRKAKAILY